MTQDDTNPWVAVYHSDTAPKSAEWMAKLYLPRIAKNGAKWQERLPIEFTACTRADVERIARQWWIDEVARIHGSVEARNAAILKARAARAVAKAKPSPPTEGEAA
jgi:hypothetical protein